MSMREITPNKINGQFSITTSRFNDIPTPRKKRPSSKPRKGSISVTVDPSEKSAEVIVPDYQLSLAIGKEGQNARLAARLTGYKIDIKSETQSLS